MNLHVTRIFNSILWLCFKLLARVGKGWHSGQQQVRVGVKLDTSFMVYVAIILRVQLHVYR